MDVTPSGIVTEVESLPEKARYPMAVTLCPSSTCGITSPLSAIPRYFVISALPSSRMRYAYSGDSMTGSTEEFTRTADRTAKISRTARTGSRKRIIFFMSFPK